MKNTYYSNLDKIIMRSKRRKMALRYAEMAGVLSKYAIGFFAIYGAFYFFWSMLCYVFPEIP